MSTSEPITAPQIDYLWSLIKAGRHEAEGVIEGPTTLEGIKALTKAEASEYIDSIKNPVAPVPVDENGEPLTAYVTVTNPAPGVHAYEMSAPARKVRTIVGVDSGNPKTSDMDNSPRQLRARIISRAKAPRYCTETAPYGWTVDELAQPGAALTPGTYKMRPITETEHDAAQAKINETKGMSLRDMAGRGLTTNTDGTA